jgi:caa(3)-type oxidase subunit IV
MSDPAQAEHPAQPFPLQDPVGDEAREHTHPHDQAHEVAHAWEHFRENLFFFGGLFFPVILLTVIAFNVDFGTWNKPVTYLLAAARSGLIAYFLAHLFKEYSFVFRTLFFTAIFLAGMIFLSLWDSQLRTIGNPIKDIVHPETDKV